MTDLTLNLQDARDFLTAHGLTLEVVFLPAGERASLRLPIQGSDFRLYTSAAEARSNYVRAVWEMQQRLDLAPLQSCPQSLSACR
ncbi:MAG: hypothetical protein PHG02_05995 [Oscillospiraceae bacterium]|nr:hypothetical protein [Oscillospiraceae bacterium]